MTTADAAKLVAILKATYVNAAIEPATIQAYARVLARLPYGAAEAAAFAHMADPDRGRFFPTPAELLAHASGLGDWAAAWDEVTAEVERWQRWWDGNTTEEWREPTWSSPEVARTVAAMGFHEQLVPAIADKRDWQWTLVRFRELYEAARRRKCAEIAGVTAPKLELLIGDAKALAVS